MSAHFTKLKETLLVKDKPSVDSVMNNQTHRFTIFTATYNRAANLRQLFEDLCDQSFKDFEWVVVSDGSTDKTDEVMAELINARRLDIKYFRLNCNGGKHKAWREGLKHFSGRYVLTADDDDPMLPNAIAVHNKYWLELEKENDYDQFWEVRSRCQNPDGTLVGEPLPTPYYDSDYIEVNVRRGNKAEMNGSRKSEILKDIAGVPPFLFEDKCSNFPEKLRWIRAAKLYKTRFVPDITRIYEPNPSGLISQRKSERSIYNTLVGGVYMLMENRWLLIKASLLLYLQEVAIVGYKSCQAHEKICKMGLHPVDCFLASCAKILFKIYFLAKRK